MVNSLFQQNHVHRVVRALQQHLPFEVNDFAFLGCTKCTYESLEDVLTAIVGEEHTELHLRAVGKTYRVRLALSSAPRGASKIGGYRKYRGVSDAH